MTNGSRDATVSEPGFYHVVLIRFHEPPDAAFLAEVQGMVGRIRIAVPGLLHYYFGTNDDPDRGRGYTHVNLSVFASRAAHEAYQAHPLHHEMRALMLPRMDFVVCDYEVPGVET